MKRAAQRGGGFVRWVLGSEGSRSLVQGRLDARSKSKQAVRWLWSSACYLPPASPAGPSAPAGLVPRGTPSSPSHSHRTARRLVRLRKEGHTRASAGARQADRRERHIRHAVGCHRISRQKQGSLEGGKERSSRRVLRIQEKRSTTRPADFKCPFQNKYVHTIFRFEFKFCD